MKRLDVHHPIKFDSSRSCVLDINVGLLHHYRNREVKGAGNGTVYDNTMHKFWGNLATRVSMAMTDIYRII